MQLPENVRCLLAAPGRGGLAADADDVTVGSILQPLDALGDRRPDVALLGLPTDTAVLGRRGTRFGPAAIRTKLAAARTYAPSLDIDLAEDFCLADCGDVDVAPTDVAASHERIRRVAAAVAARAGRLCALGGDHGTTFGTVSGLLDAHGGPLGLVVFDAHHDVRVVRDGVLNSGTPFRRLLELPGTPVRGGNVAQIGIADWRNSRAYTDYCRGQGVLLIPARQVHRDGIAAAVAAAVERASADTGGFFISFDMDVLDVPFAPGVSAHSPGGLTAYQALEAVYLAAAHPACRGFDLVEVAPLLDVQEWTSELAATLVLQFCAGAYWAGRG